MGFKTFLCTPFHFFRDAFRHFRAGPPRPTWSFPLHFCVNMLRRIMEANKTNVRSARFFTNITSPTSWNVRIEAVYIPRIEMAGVGDEGGFIQGEWVDHRPTTKRLERGNVMSKGHGKPLAPTSAPSAAQAEVKIDIENDKITGQKVILYMHGTCFDCMEM